MSQEDLLKDFETRFNALREENGNLANKVRENEQQMLKLQGAMETLNYLKQNESPQEETTE
tara:strand:+ start:16625 stop:16807 length:183 start_codon:yes stop_codon:yes gene_type:complete